MLRALGMALFVLLVGIMSIILIPLAFLIGVFSKEKRLSFSFSFVKWCIKVLKTISGAEVVYKGLEYLDNEGPVVYIGNHRGLFDILLTYPVFKNPTGFVAKKEMKTWPVVGWWMWLVNCIFIDRKNLMAGLKAISRAIQNIKAGTSMVIFPEGTRSKIEGELLDFKPGSFKMATKPKVKIIPVAINNTSMLFEDHVPYVKKAKVSIEFCEPIDTKDLTPDEEKVLHQRVQDLIYEKIRINGKEIGSL